MNTTIGNKDERVISFKENLNQISIKIEEICANYKPLMNGERFLTDEEVAKILRISRRTLQDYRDKRLVAYSAIGGKILYKESDIIQLFYKNYISVK